MTRLVSFVILVSLLLTGCGQPSAPAAPKAQTKAPTTLRLNLTAEPNTLDPGVANWAVESYAITQVFVGLVAFDNEDKIVNKIADKITVSPDQKTYTFTLKKGVKFHNGREVTAEDFVWTITRALLPATKSGVGILYLNDIVGAKDVADGKTTKLEGIVAKDKYTLEIKIDSPKPYFLAKLAYPTSYVIAKEEVEKGPKWTEGHLAGAGPFILEKWVHQDRVIMRANKDYFEGAPQIDRIEWLMVNDENTALLMYKNGELDVAEVPAVQLDTVKKDPVLSKELKVHGKTSIEYMSLNSAAYKPFQDKRVREAFLMAIDRKALVDVIYRGTRQLAGSMLPPGVPGNDPNAKTIPFDPKQAKALLAAAGYADPKKLPEVTISFNTKKVNEDKIAEFNQGQLQQNLGIKVKVAGLEAGAYNNDRSNGKFQIHQGGWNCDYPDAQNVLSLLFGAKSPYSKRYGYSTPEFKEFNALIDKADVGADAAQRAALYKQADQVLVNDACVTPVCYGTWMWVEKPYVKNYVRSASDILPFLKTQIVK